MSESAHGLCLYEEYYRKYQTEASTEVPPAPTAAAAKQGLCLSHYINFAPLAWKAIKKLKAKISGISTLHQKGSFNPGEGGHVAGLKESVNLCTSVLLADS